MVGAVPRGHGRPVRGPVPRCSARRRIIAHGTMRWPEAREQGLGKVVVVVLW